jgi:hypothetical protein
VEKRRVPGLRVWQYRLNLDIPRREIP